MENTSALSHTASAEQLALADAQQSTTNPDQDVEILSWLAEALRGLVRTDLCIAYVAEGSDTVHIVSARALDRDDVRRLLGSLSAATHWHGDGQPWQKVLLNGRVLQDLPTEAQPGLRRITPLPLAISGRQIGAMAIGTWDELLGPRSLTALKRIATEVGTALQALWHTVARERDKLDAILQNLIDGILLIGQDGTVRAANLTARKLVPLRKQASRWELRDDPTAPPLRQYLEEAQQGHQFEFNRIWRSEASPRRVLGVKGRRIRDAENRDWGWLIQVRDITQSWYAERFRNDVLSIASHEIHTPLTSMNDAVSLLLEGGLGELSDKQRHLLELLRDDITRVARLVDRLLDVGRYESPAYPVERRHHLDVARTLQNAVDNIQYRAARKSLSLITVIPETLPRVKGDRDRLLQVVQNLLDNSMKFTPVGGAIEVGAKRESGEILVWVRDTGIGIPEEYQEWIFEKFAKLRPGDEDADEEEERTDGHGLGLSIARAIVESWGGRIWVESKPGEGSVFRFTIPLVEAGKSTAESIADGDELSGRRRTSE